MGCLNSKPKRADASTGPRFHANDRGHSADDRANIRTVNGIIVGSGAAFKKDLDPKDFMFDNRESEVLVKPPGSVSGQQFVIMDCSNCDIFVCDHCEMVTIDRCDGCRIFIGPCESSIFVRNCSNTKLIAACRQFRTRDCNGLDVLMHCSSQPSIETSTRVRFGCFRFFYFSLAQQFEHARLSPFNNRWSEVYNFSPGHGAHSLFGGEDADPTRLLKPLHEVADFATADEVAQWDSQCPVPRSVGSAQAEGLEDAVVVCSPRLGQEGSLDLTRKLQDDAGLVLVRAIEFSLDSAWQTKLTGALAQSVDKQALGPFADHARFVVLHVAGDSSRAKAAAAVSDLNSAAGASQALCSRSGEEADHMASAIFVSDDSGMAFH